MRKVVVTEFVTLDGVVEDPHLWSFPYWGDDIGDFKFKELFASDALLLGRVTYEGFAAAWPEREGKDPTGFADRFNQMPKYVASTTLKNPEWKNSHVLEGNVADEVRKLKEHDGQDIGVHGSPTLVNSLIKDDLVDEYHLIVYPIVLGKGKRLFAEGIETKMKLVEVKPFKSGAIGLVYQRADQSGEAEAASQ